MSTVTNVSSFIPPSYAPRSVSSRGPASSDASSAGNTTPTDVVDLSPAMQRQMSEAGRIALNLGAGKLTSDQATQLYQQGQSIQAQITADRKADGGTLSPQDAQAIDQLQTQLSSTIYSDAHNGAPVPTNPPAQNPATERAVMQAGRIELNAQAGNITSSQAQQLKAQQAQIDQQIASDMKANGGTLTPEQAQAIQQLQDQASKQIYQTVHPS